MPLAIPGAESSESLTQFSCDSSISNAGLTVFAAAVRFVHRGPTTWEGSTGTKIFNSESNHNNGMGVTTSGVSNSVYMNIRLRTAKKNSYSHAVLATPDVVTNYAIRADFINQVIHFIVDGVAIDPPTPMEEEDTWNSSNLQPFLRSQVGVGKDTEWHAAAVWTNAGDTDPENVDANVPTLAQLEALTAGGSFEDTPPAKRSWIEPVGTDGAYAGTFPDLAMTGQVWSQTTGPTTGDFAPYFVGPPAEVDVNAEATARTLNIEGITSVSGGTVYVIVDTVANMPTPPDAADIAGGFLGDGATAAAFSDSAAMATTALEFSFEGVPASTALAYALVHDKDGAGDYSDVTYGTISTKRPVIVPATAEKRLLDAGEPVISETGMTMWVLGTEYSQAGYATDSAGLFELDLTEYLNTAGTKDIGDTIDIVLTLADGERGIVAMGQTITEGD